MGRERQIKKNEETRKLIIDTALSIRKITDRLGYSSGIVYHYFKDKQEILNTIHTQTSMELKDAVDSCIREDRSFAENTGLVFKMVSEISVHEPETFKLIMLNKYPHCSDSVNVWIDMIKHCIEIGIKSGELRNVDSNITSYIVTISSPEGYSSGKNFISVLSKSDAAADTAATAPSYDFLRAIIHFSAPTVFAIILNVLTISKAYFLSTCLWSIIAYYRRRSKSFFKFF